MAETSSRQFGLIVAYLLPGFIGLAGLSPLFPAVQDWLQPVKEGAFGFGPPIYAILSAIAVGMIVSCMRWLIIDHLHHWTGIRRPEWNDSALDRCLDAFNYIVEAHYRYYQFYANTLVALLLAYGMNRLGGKLPLLDMGTDLGVFLLCAVLFVGSRDALAKYYLRTGRLIGQVTEKGDCGKVMTNGNHHAEETSNSKRSSLADKPQVKPEGSGKQQPTQAKSGQKPK